MKRTHGAVAGCLFILAGCVGRPDHFYMLTALGGSERTATLTAPTVHVALNITIPAVVDRREMVVHESLGQVQILEHERWASPLADEVSSTLARDIERRRSDVLVGDRAFDRPDAPPIKITVAVVQFAAQKNSQASLEARWRIVDPRTRTDQIGAEIFTAPIAADSFASVAAGLSACLAQLADRLTENIPSP